MKLTKKDKELLQQWGYSCDDIKQVQQAATRKYLKLSLEIENKTTGVVIEKEKSITQKQSLLIIDRKTFLSGLSRAAFHWNSSREKEEGNKRYIISFDCSKLFLN